MRQIIDLLPHRTEHFTHEVDVPGCGGALCEGDYPVSCLVMDGVEVRHLHWFRICPLAPML